MSFLVKVEGSESFEVEKECVRSVKVTTDIPLDSNARTKDVGATMVITGKILAALDGDITDSTRKLALWSVVPAESGLLSEGDSRACGRRRNGEKILFPKRICA